MNIVDIKSSDTMSKYMNELVRIGMLYSKKTGTTRKMRNGGYVKFDTPTCYALEERFLEQSESVLKDYYGTTDIIAYNDKKDKPPVNHNPVRPLKDKSSTSKSYTPVNKVKSDKLPWETTKVDRLKVDNIILDNKKDESTKIEALAQVKFTSQPTKKKATDLYFKIRNKDSDVLRFIIKEENLSFDTRNWSEEQCNNFINSFYIYCPDLFDEDDYKCNDKDNLSYMDDSINKPNSHSYEMIPDGDDCELPFS